MNVLRPLQLHTADWIGKNLNKQPFRGFEPRPPHRWMLTDVDLVGKLRHGYAEHTFHGVVQFRIVGLDNIRVGGFSLGQLIWSVSGERRNHPFIDVVRAHTHGDAVPENNDSWGKVITIDAIYHESFVALPHQWRCPTEQVLASEEQYVRLLEAATVSKIRGGRACFCLGEWQSARIGYFAEPRLAHWQVGDERFAVEPHKRPELTQGYQWNTSMLNRFPQGWSENTEPYHLPDWPAVDINPDHLTGIPLKPNPEATAAMKADFKRHAVPVVKPDP